MINNSGKFSDRIVYFIFIPLIMSLLFIRQIGFNMAYIVMMLQCMIFIFSANKIKLSYKKEQLIMFLLFFILFTTAIFSSLFSNFQLEAFRLSFLVFVPSFFLILLTFSDHNPKYTFIKVSKLQMSIGTTLALIAIFLFIFGSIAQISGRTVQIFSIGPFRLYQIIMGMPPYYRVASLTTNPNSLGIILMLSQVATLYLFKIKLVSRNKFLLVYIIQITSLLLTQSRSAIITTFIMIIIFNLFTSRNIINTFKIYAMSAATSMFAYYLIIIQNNNILSRFKSGLSNRDLAWEILLDKIMNNPFIGVGFGVSSDVFFYDLEIKSHNIFLNSISEIGIIGFLVFIFIWLLGIIYSFLGVRSNIDNPVEKATYATVLSILFSLIFHQMVENKLLVYDFMMLFWVYLITFSTLRLEGKNKV